MLTPQIYHTITCTQFIAAKTVEQRRCLMFQLLPITEICLKDLVHYCFHLGDPFKIVLFMGTSTIFFKNLNKENRLTMNKTKPNPQDAGFYLKIQNLSPLTREDIKKYICTQWRICVT